MSILADILRKKQAGIPFSQLLSGDRQPPRACSASTALLEELRGKLYLVFPEDYEVTCYSCGETFAPVVRTDALVTCKCGVQTAIEKPLPGREWVRFNCCNHLTDMEKDGAAPDRCPKCGEGKKESDGHIYSVCAVVKPLRQDRDTKAKCKWGGCEKTFIPRIFENSCLICTECRRPNPARKIAEKKWVYYSCHHLQLLLMKETPPIACPTCKQQKNCSAWLGLTKPQWIIPCPKYSEEKSASNELNPSNYELPE